jgi:hypothetical protein
MQCKGKKGDNIPILITVRRDLVSYRLGDTSDVSPVRKHVAQIGLRIRLAGHLLDVGALEKVLLILFTYIDFI